MVYDLVYGRTTRSEVRALLKISSIVLGTPASVPPAARLLTWIEPACGTGRLLIELARQTPGRCIGVDLHPAMLARGQTRSRRAGLSDRIRLDLLDMRLVHRALTPADPHPRLAFCLDNSIRHLPTDAALVEHLASIRRIIQSRKTPGAYLVGIGLTPDAGEFPSEYAAHVRRANLVVRQVVEFLPPDPSASVPKRSSRIEHAYGHIAVSSPRGEQDIFTHHQLRTYRLAEWHRAIKRAGLRETHVLTPSGRPLPSDRTAYAIRVLRP